MRIILWVSAIIGAAAIGGAAAAQSWSAPGGRGGGSHGGWHSGGTGLVFHGHRPFRPHPGKGRGRHRGRHGHRGADFVGLYGAGGIAGPFEAVDPHGIGFFAGGGGRVRVEGGRASYDYDRSYPYEWASAAGRTPVRAVEESGYRPAPSCAVENDVRVCRGGR